MADENEPADGAGQLELESNERTENVGAASEPSLRERLGRNRFRRQVRAGFQAELRKAGKKRGSHFRESEAPDLAADLTDADIDRATEEFAAGEEGAGNKTGKIGDWFKDHPAVGEIVALLLKKFLGA